MIETFCQCDICKRSTNPKNHYVLPFLSFLHTDNYGNKYPNDFTHIEKREVDLCEKCTKEIADYITFVICSQNRLKLMRLMDDE